MSKRVWAAIRYRGRLALAFIFSLAMVTVAQADDAARHSPAVIAAVSAYNRGDFGTAFAILRGEADRGDSDAEVNLGYLYERGQGVGRDQSQAFHLFVLSAQQGNGEGMYALGYKYEIGFGIKRDVNQAIRWYCAAVHHGNPRAMNSLAIMLSNGNEVPRDLAAARDLWQQAVDRGDINAMYNFGSSLLLSPPGSEEHQMGARLMVEAALRGMQSAQLILQVPTFRYYTGSFPPIVDFGRQMKLQPPNAAPGHADICGSLIS